MNQIRAAVLTVSDRCAAGQAEDTSGPAVCALLRDSLGAEVALTGCVPDERDRIAGTVSAWAHGDDRIDLIVTVGGTGLAPRDITPEAVGGVVERMAPGLMELARARCMPSTPRAFLSRGIAGTIGRTLVITVPGSVRGATEQLGAITDVLPHAIAMARGQDTSHTGPQP